MKSMKKVVSGSGLEKHHVTNRVWRGPKPHPIDKYHMFREVGWDPLGSFWEAFGLAFGTFLVTFRAPDRTWGSQNRFQKETWKSDDFRLVSGTPGQQQPMQDHARFGGVSPYKD